MPEINGNGLSHQPDEDNGPMWEPESQTVMLLAACLKLAKENKINSIGLVLITEPGKYQVTAAGPDVDGLLAGSKELRKQMKALVEGLPKPSKIIRA